MSLNPTEEQRAILDALRDPRSLMINAYAGTGKSTTLEMIAHALPGDVSLAVAFNKRIADELRKRFPPNFTIATLNGLGHRAIANKLGKKLTLNDRKVGDSLSSVAKEANVKLLDADWAEVMSLVRKARNALLVPLCVTDKVRPDVSSYLTMDTEAAWRALSDAADLPRELIELARSTLVEVIRLSFEGTIDFDDQVYFSTLFTGGYGQFKRVLVDESQDLSPGNHLQIAATLGPRSKLIVVGDRLQAIYAFRGADATSMDSLRALRPEWVELPLATTFRCPRKIVARNAHHAKGYVAHEHNTDGRVEAMPKPWKWTNLEDIALNRQVAVLCRNNAPIVTLAFRLLRRRIPATILGRELGKGLTTLVKKLTPNLDTPIADFWPRLDAWREKECALHELNGDERKADLVWDKYECIKAMDDEGALHSVRDLITRIDNLFAQEGRKVVLSTIHKAKGLEWPVVVHLDPWRIPAKFARTPSQREQELNLKYVAETRTQDVLIEANLEDME